MRTIGRVSLALMLMFAGLQFGTQWSARMLPPKDRGPAWITLVGTQVYRPYQGLVWFVMADQAYLVDLLVPIGVTVASVFGGFLLLRWSLGGGRRHQPEQRISGARWATRDDLRKGGLL